MAWSKDIRTTLKPYCSSLLDKIASEAYLDVWTAITELVVAFSSPVDSAAPTTPTAPTSSQEDYSKTSNEEDGPILRGLRSNWTNAYLPKSLEVL